MTSAKPQLIELRRGQPGYPARITQRLTPDTPATMWVVGDPALLIRELVAVFCSIRCPGNEILKLYDLARGLRDAGVGVISGFHTPMEKECLVTLLRGTQPIVICPARSLHRMRIPQEWRTGIDAGRLALVSAFPSSVARASRETAATRNHLVAALASKVVIAYAEPGGQTSKLAEELTKAGRKPLNLDAEELRPYRPG